LRKNPLIDGRVFVIWFRMLEGDEQGRWPRQVFSDPRVTQRWDEPKLTGVWFLEHLKDLKPAHDVAGKFPQDVDAMWDTWMLFDRGAQWTDVPRGLLSWGYPIIKTNAQLAADFSALAAARAPAR
jgi:hypothetical protein